MPRRPRRGCSPRSLATPAAAAPVRRAKDRPQSPAADRGGGHAAAERAEAVGVRGARGQRAGPSLHHI
jgi:hypothetical protein